MIVCALEGSWTIFENPAIKRSSLIDGGTETTEVELLLVNQSLKLKYALIFEVDLSDVFPTSFDQYFNLILQEVVIFSPAISVVWVPVGPGRL